MAREPPSLARARESMHGLSVGDAFGERFYSPEASRWVEERFVPPGPWRTTDDSEMGIAIFEALRDRGEIEPDDLALRFARRYVRDPARGYGGTAHRILQEIAAGRHWNDASQEPFGGEGSQGNGAAMRVAPIGAFFAGDVSQVIEQARRSAIVTHAHREGQQGAIAVALAAAFACSIRGRAVDRTDLLDAVLTHLDASDVRAGLERARGLPPDAGVAAAAAALGTGQKVLASDTVPFAIWCASRHPDRFDAALWTAVAGLGDRDTICAIVGGIVALSCSPDSIPPSWIAAREALHFERV